MTTSAEHFTLEFEDGKLRIGGNEPGRAAPVEGTPGNPDAARNAEMWEQLARIAEGKGAFPDTARRLELLDTIVWVIAIALPLAALTLTIAAGESLETIVFVTFGAAFIAAMLRRSIR